MSNGRHNSIKGWTALALTAAAAGLYALAYQLPFWKFTLHAPQYPDGLNLVIYLDHLGGRVREINGLNHYIGMAKLQNAAQFERAFAPWGVALVALLSAGFVIFGGRKTKWLALAPAAALPLGFIGDTFYWLYRFGHNLSPRAPIEFPSFTPSMFGAGKIGQFSTVAGPGVGFWLTLVAFGLIAGALWLKHTYESPGRSGSIVPVAALVGLMLVGCQNGHARESTPAPAPKMPEACRHVPPGGGLQEAIRDADPGAQICLGEGEYPGQFDLKKPVEIWGTPESVVRNSEDGSTFRIGADGVELHGFQIVGSGDRYTKQDAGVFILEADDVVLDGLDMRDVLFGVSAQKSNRLTVRDTDIACRHQEELGMRGDGIRFWEVRRSRVVDNQMRNCRDLVVWYSPENLIQGNEYIGGRYGTHFMYSSRNIVRDNIYRDNSVGIFVMYSRHIRIANNVFARGSGTSGMGLGLKESGDLEIVGNTMADNAEGTYIDASPLQNTNHLLYALNDFRLNHTGIVFHNEPERTTFVSNTFRHNGSVARIQGGGTATTADWQRNYFGTYAGYDMDHDGTGDVPYELRSFSQTLQSRYPKLEFLTGTPAMAFIETATKLAPLYQPDVLVRDDTPRMRPPDRRTAEHRQRAIYEKHGFLRIRDGEHVPLVDPPDRALSKEY
jgi:nitrous oxidase accessory protein